MKKSKAKNAGEAPSGNGGPIVFQIEGKMSTFGGPNDTGMTPSEGLALFDNRDLRNPKHAGLFLPASPPATSGLGRRLNPDKFYIACRWNYSQTSHEFLRNTTALVENPQNGRQASARPVDFGPNVSTGRVADLSPGLAAFLVLDTDEDVTVTITTGMSAVPAPKATPGGNDSGHGSNNPHLKPSTEFIPSPFHSSRNGAKIEFIVLHCTESSLESTIQEFKEGNRQVSAHYVIARDGRIIQMVRDSERANHARGANSSSIGIEHVAGKNDSLTSAQKDSSVNLIRWLLQQYDIPRTQIYGHDFAPGYTADTSCPDKLFGTPHSQQTIATWVATNI